MKVFLHEWKILENIIILKKNTGNALKFDKNEWEMSKN